MNPDSNLVLFVDGWLEPAPPIEWAVGCLCEALDGARRPYRKQTGHAVPPEPALVVTTIRSPLARDLLARQGLQAPERPEEFLLFSSLRDGGQTLVACGADVQGSVYAVLELADRVGTAPAGQPLLTPRDVVAGRPANAVRGVARAFVSERADMRWFSDRSFWPEYLTTLVKSRFNRFHLALGMGYDFFYQAEVTDTYFLFPYPFLVDLPGSAVRAEGLSPDERDRNLAMLRFIGEESARRGIHFQLGLWTHGYSWIEGSNINYPIRGITEATHDSYCREGLAALLAACPAIQGVTLRVHGESGISEGAPRFWNNLFGAIADCGRTVEIDLHSKGLGHDVVDAAVATGMPVTVSPKFAAEHMGLPYHLASIRAREQRPRSSGGPDTQSTPDGLKEIMRLSAGSRSFTRYSYGDFLARDRQYAVLYRIWPGTQRLLLWGDPAFAAALGRAGGFGGALGMEVCEPLYFAGRRGSWDSGESGTDSSWRDHRFYEYTYQVLGRHLYEPGHTEAEDRRCLAREFGESSAALQSALGPASRILPLLTTAHCPSAANNSYWPEVYTNMPIVSGIGDHPYRDTRLPGTFGSVSPLDPALFSSIDEFVLEALADEPSGRYTPLQVAGWLEGLGASALERIRGTAMPRGAAGERFTAMVDDVRVQAGLGHFFAAKIRAAAFYEMGRRLGDRSLLSLAVEHYRTARDQWKALAAVGGRHHGPDLIFGPNAWLRGHWDDRLDGVEQDLRALEADANRGGAPPRDRRNEAEAWLRRLEDIGLPPAPAEAVRVTESALADGAGEVEVCARVTSAPPFGPARRVTLRYRPMNQAAHYSSVEMLPGQHGHIARVDDGGPTGGFDTQYFLTVESADGRRWIYPGLGGSLLDQPYRVVSRARVH